MTSGEKNAFRVGRPSQMTRDAFVSAFGACFENAPWAAERAWDEGLDESCDSPDGLHQKMARQVADAGREKQDELLCVHPELAAARLESLGPDSRREQQGAGLTEMDAQTRQCFLDLNRDYRRKFGFPFIVSVAGMSRDDILREMTQRLAENDCEAERGRALAEAIKIARARLLRLTE